MNTNKRIKDPVHGYILISCEYCSQIVDTAEFQRLRYIQQTSYSCLYPGATHNRFIHSIGTYHLGNKAIECFFENIQHKLDTSVFTDSVKNKLKTTFGLACLLHDFGHAPFSHTGEKFFLENLVENSDKKELYERFNKLFKKNKIFFRELTNYYHIQELSKKNRYCTEQNGYPYSAKPHEIMSAMCALQQFGEYFDQIDINKEFFARAITGYLHRGKCDELQQIENCLISLLNSQTIDVDKLDYVMRDIQTTGYDSISIDIERLLSSLTYYKDSAGNCTIAYNRQSLSILENVIMANDLERRWIQGHPVVLYEMKLISHCIEVVCDSPKTKKGNNFHNNIFVPENLVSDERKNQPIKLLCDSDILYFAKQNLRDPLIMELFSRKDRRVACWKSEAKYALSITKIMVKGDVSKRLTEIMQVLELYLGRLKKRKHIFCEESILEIEEELEQIKDKSMIKGRTFILFWLKAIKEYCERKNVPFDLLLIHTKRFKTSLTAAKLGYIYIEDGNDYYALKDYFPDLLRDSSDQDDLFFFYQKRSKNKIEIDDFMTYLFQKTLQSMRDFGNITFGF